MVGFFCNTSLIPSAMSGNTISYRHVQVKPHWLTSCCHLPTQIDITLFSKMDNSLNGSTFLSGQNSC